MHASRAVAVTETGFASDRPALSRSPAILSGLVSALCAGLSLSAWASTASTDGGSTGATDGGSAESALFERLEGIEELTLEEILNSETSVTATTPQPLRVAPGVVTVLERAELVASGARDLIDVLHLVPGFAFGVDTEGVVGVAFRGNWAMEGKVLVLVDGHELNETLYLTAPFGHELAVEQIERVELIRGPGSAVYGGFAELAVVNVTTRSAETLRGPSLAARASLLPDSSSAGRTSLALAYGDVFQVAGDLRVAASLRLGDGVRSGALQTDALGQTFSMAEDSRLRPTSVALNLDWRELTVSLRYQELAYRDRLGYGETLPVAVWGRFTGLYALASYVLKLPHGVTITPRLRWKRQLPWNIPHGDPRIPESIPYDRTAQRWDASLTAKWEPTPWLSLSGGGQYTYDHAWLNDHASIAETADTLDAFFLDGKPRTWLSFGNLALFAEGTVRTVVDVTAGARFEHHSHYGNSFVPRVAVTKLLGAFHAKALVAQAFRAPGIENISERSDIEPERATHVELEAGYLVTPWLHASLTGFAVLLEKPIYYTYDVATEQDTYINGKSAGSCGVEVQARLKRPVVSAVLGYSWYTSRCREQPPIIQVPGVLGSVLGLANHKATLTGNLEIGSELTVDPSLLYFSRRWYLGPGDDGAVVARAAPQAVLADLFLTWRGKVLRGGAVSLGIHNLFGQRFDFIQPYDGGMPPMRGFDREVTLRLTYDVP